MKKMLQSMEGVVMTKMTTAARRRRAMKKREREMKDMEMRREERGTRNHRQGEVVMSPTYIVYFCFISKTSKI
jgi:hypothetical protein